jgi:DNA polymerase-1
MADAEQTLYLIDGHAQIFRSYFAIRGGMSSPVTGEPTHAVFAFAGMLLKLYGNLKPRHVAMAIDMGGSAVREELYPAYKATREPPPDDFKPQEQRIFELVKLWGIPILGRENVEADDIIASVCKRLLANHPGLHIKLVTKDKDLKQLLSDRVTMYDIHTDTTIDVARLKEEEGITPEQVVDVLTLMGDTIDNVPGVEGVGQKTAAKLVQEFGSVENLLANLDKVKGKRRENIERAAAQLPLSKKLVSLIDDVDIPFTLEDAAVDGRTDVAAVKQFFRNLGFRRHVTDLESIFGAADSAADDSTDNPPATEPGPPTGAGSRPTEASTADGGFSGGLFGHLADEPPNPNDSPAADLQSAAGCDYSAITTRQQLDDLVTTLRQQAMFAIDTETRSLGPHTGLCGLSFAWRDKCGVYVPICSPQQSEHLDRNIVLDALKPVLEDPAVPKCGHNVKYDILALRHEGIRLRGVAFDSMIGAALMGLPGHGLDALALSVLQHSTIPLSDLIDDKGRDGKPRFMDAVALDRIARYAAEDADVTWRLCQYMRPRLATMGLSKLLDEVETPLVGVLADMEWAGITVDPDELDRQRERLDGRAKALRREIIDTAAVDFNPDSPKQLADVLFKRLKLPVIKRTKTGPSTDIEVLQRLAERETSDPRETQLPALVIEYRELTKLLGTYLEALKLAIRPQTRRVHTTFNQVAAATGRLSSNDPNLQNIPIRTETGRQIRRAFVAAPGPPESRLVVADYSQIELRVLAHLSDDEALRKAFADDIDIHRAVAAEVFNVPADRVTSQQRGHAKVINFGIIYGVTAFGLARRIEGLDVEGARKLIADYRARFSGIDRFLHDCVAEAELKGYVTTMMGRRRPIPQVQARHPQQRALGERLAINTVVQGSAADLIKAAMVNLHARIERDHLPMTILLQIHDELVCETPVDHAEAMAAIVREEMEQAVKLKVPLRVETGVGCDWFSAKE